MLLYDSVGASKCSDLYFGKEAFVTQSQHLCLEANNLVKNVLKAPFLYFKGTRREVGKNQKVK